MSPCLVILAVSRNENYWQNLNVMNKLIIKDMPGKHVTKITEINCK